MKRQSFFMLAIIISFVFTPCASGIIELYVTHYGEPSEVARHNILTGEYVDTFVSGFHATDIDFGPDGDLYMTQAAEGGPLVRLDGGTGDVVYTIEPWYDSSIDSFAFIPEPSSIILLGLGTLLIRRRNEESLN